MAGYREFMPGQVWFYYNMNSSKEVEKRKELGACTNRPVVIVQSAFYPEWSDIITVCPMTSSDRRSGVFIDSTILKDGSIVEGGTVLPYLFFNIKTKFLYPLITSSHRRKILSLSPEDFAKVQNGFLYHLGASATVPDYVEHWKHLDDYDRTVVIKDIRLALNDYEEIAYDSVRSTVDNVVKKSTINPILSQAIPETDRVENHIIASLDHFDRSQKMLYSTEKEDSPYTESTIENPDPSLKETKEVRYDRYINFTKMDTGSFANLLGDLVGGFFPWHKNSVVYPDSECLQNVNITDIPSVLSKEDQLKIAMLPAGEIMKQTGIASESSAYRVRKMIREQDWSGYAYYDDELKKMVLSQDETPDPFRHTSLILLSKAACRKNAKRRKTLFNWTPDTVESFIMMNEEGKKSFLDLNGLKNLESVEKDLKILYPNLYEKEQETLPSDSSQDEIYDFWDTLSPAEIKEIKSATKRTLLAVSKNFGITKDAAKTLRGQVLNMVGRNPEMKQQEVDLDVKECCARVIENTPINNRDLLVYCRTDPNEIAKVFGDLKFDNTPSKSEIRKLKIAIRRCITRDIR